MNLDLTRQPLAIERGADEDLWKFDGATTFDLDKHVLLDDIRHLLLLLLAFVDLLFQIRDLLSYSVEAVLVDRAICDRTNEGGIRVLEWLQVRGSAWQAGTGRK